MPAASGSLLVCTAGLMAMIGLWADTEHILGKLLAGPVMAPVALLRIAFGGHSGDRDGLTGALAASEDACGEAVHGITSHIPETVGWLIPHANGCFGSAGPGCPGQAEMRCAR